MAKLIPNRSSCLSRMTTGERRFSERLEQKLEDDYLCWYNVPIGVKQLQPDFVIFHPSRGILALEVKDWKLSTIQSFDRSSFKLQTNQGLVPKVNPLLQARVYALEVVQALEKDPALRSPPDHKYAGKLFMPYGWGVILTNIKREQFQERMLDQVIEPHLVICQDEMLDSVDPEAFQKRLWDMFRVTFPCLLSLPQIDRVRWHMFPEIRVPPDPGQFGLFPGDDGNAGIPDLIKVMDLQQEQLSRALGDGHRVIHGVAGSGKTMILGYRCLQMAKATTKPILVLCYNIALAARLRAVIDSRGAGAHVSVRSFHAWCREQLISYNIPLPTEKGNDFFRPMVDLVIQSVDKGHIPRAQYAAVLIDEGHDLEDEWLKLIVQMIDPSSNSLLLLYDDAQAIYTKGDRRKVSFEALGIKARGRSTILKLNYRNTLEILTVAKAFADSLLFEQAADEDAAPLIEPSSVGRRGQVPMLVRAKSLSQEAEIISEQVLDEVGNGRSLDDIGILYRSSEVSEVIERQFRKLKIPYRVGHTTAQKKALYDGNPAIKMVSMHSSKGLEFSSVYIPGVDYLPKHGEDEQDESRLLYVAMTRATDRLILTHHQDSLFSSRVRAAVDRANAIG